MQPYIQETALQVPCGYNPEHHKAPIIIMAYDSNNAAQRNMWNSNESLHDLLAPDTPNDTHFLFMSYAAAAREDMLGIAERLGKALQGLPKELQAVRRRQLHFATSPLPSLQGSSWLPQLLSSWQSPRRVLHVQTTAGNWGLVAARLDGRFAFVPSPEGLSGLRVVIVRDACSMPEPEEIAAASGDSSTPRSTTGMTPGMTAALAAQRRRSAAGQAAAADSGATSTHTQSHARTTTGEAAASTATQGDHGIRGMAALVVQREGTPLECSYPQLLRKLGHAGAAAAIIGSVPGSDVTEIQCRQEECDWEITVPATMIVHEDAQKIATAIHWFEQTASHNSTQQRVVADFKTEEVAGNFAGIDARGRVVELGWQVFPTLKQLAWEAQWLAFRAELAANLSRPALVVPIFEPQILPEPGDLQVNVTMPSAKRLAGLDTLELDFSLSCPGHFDADCPQWDHVLQLHACCGGHCKPCPPLVWLSGQGSSAGTNASSVDAACGAELGRWITPFRRRVGRWLTDVSELRPLLKPGASCRFTLQAPPWAPGWKPALNLWFSSSKRHGAESTLLQEAGRRLQRKADLQSKSPYDLDRDSRQTSRALLGPLAMQLSAARRRRRRQEHTTQHAAQRAASVTNNPPTGHPRSAIAVGADGSSSAAERSPEAERPAHSGSGSRKGRAGWRAEGLQPFHVLPLWEGGTFDEKYNLGRNSIDFTAPAGTRRVLLEAVITGHGYDLVNLQCAEFCITSHHFKVNGAEHSVTYREAGTQWGCADKVRSGSVPNEHGTWQFGRMGWCDGQEVRPWVVDITAVVKSASSSMVSGANNSSNGTNTISYRGLFKGKDPQPSSTAGYIMMESNLVFLGDDSWTADG